MIGYEWRWILRARTNWKQYKADLKWMLDNFNKMSHEWFKGLVNE